MLSQKTNKNNKTNKMAPQAILQTSVYIETSPSVYNDAYLDEVEELVQRLAKRGIYTILDSHQDMFSRVLCGEGVPVFYTPEWSELDHECPW